jgi:hypothetical protein
MTGRKLAIYSYRFSPASIPQLSAEDIILHNGAVSHGMSLSNER